MLKRVYLVATFCWLFLLQACGQDSSSAYNLMLKGLYKKTVPQITPDKLIQKLQKDNAVILLDTRTLTEYNVSHLKGARFIDYDHFLPEVMATVPKSATVVVYCSVGYRSERIGEKLQQAGFTNVKNLYGGLFQWVNEKKPVYNATGRTQQVHPYSKEWGIWLREGEKVYGTE